MGQNEQILDYLRKNGSITQAEAVERFGCYRLGARIWDLKRRGIRIRRRMEEGLNRFGIKTRYARYTIQGADDGA
jgi:hypothetical protein